MNESTLQGKWKEIKGEIQKAWGNLTNDELEQTKGNMTAISGLIQQKYGHSKDDVTAKLKDVTDRYAVQGTDAVKESLRKDVKEDENRH